MLQDYDSAAVRDKILQTQENEQLMTTFKALNGKLREDGNQWCAIVGEMPENYIAGFGITPNAALYDWWGSMYKSK